MTFQSGTFKSPRVFELLLKVVSVLKMLFLLKYLLYAKNAFLAKKLSLLPTATFVWLTLCFVIF